MQWEIRKDKLIRVSSECKEINFVKLKEIDEKLVIQFSIDGIQCCFSIFRTYNINCKYSILNMFPS